ncbi:MAG TPA: hypothetical protein VLV49_17775 [Terriglobales bacterium]|nr:hypothetical protein [Terriglobales bacterium]
MNYLSPSEYGAYGLEATTPAAWVTAASAVIDAHCRRATLAVTQYEERRRMTAGRNTVRLSYLPLAALAPAATPLVSARGRYTIPRRGEWPYDDLSVDVALMFGLPGTWNAIDPATIDFDPETGELMLPLSPIGLWFSELDVTYTAGLDAIPDAVKVACAQIVRNAQATPALNVKSGNLDRMHMDYFSDSLVDGTSKSLLAPYVAQKVG